MKRILFVVAAISSVLMSCQQSLVPEKLATSTATDEIQTKSITTDKFTDERPIVFLPASDMKSWTDIGPLEKRFAACEVPASRLDRMTTEALLKSMINYPLNYLVFVYNSPKAAIDIIIENSPLHQEFLSRDDAAEVFVNMYASAEMDFCLDKSNYDGDYTRLSYTNALFLDHFVGSKVLPGLGEASIKSKLSEAVRTKLVSRVQNETIFSMFSIEPLLTIDRVESLGVASISTRASVVSTVIVYTPWGQEITAFTMSSTSPAEAAYMENQATSEYPSAIVRGPATWSYNCHSYAWHNQSTDNNVWINSYLSDPSDKQIERYWTNDLYDEVQMNSPDTEIVYYANGDHSAITLANGNYQSKWGAWPLMEHSSEDCPYNSTGLRFFKKKTTDHISITISGQTSVITNQTYPYSVSIPVGYSNLDLIWEVRYMDEPYPTPFNIIVSPNGTWASLTCQDYGLYKIIVRGYRNGKYMAYGQLDVISMPEM